MSAIQHLLTEHLDIWTAADTGPKSGRGRSSANAAKVYGISKLRELILQLAITGRLSFGKREEWPEITLDDVGEWGSGGTPLKTHPEYYGGDIPWLIIGDLNDGVVTGAETHITAAGLNNSSTKMVPAGALLIAMYGSIGKLGIAGIECATNQAIAFCIPDHERVLTKYLFTYLMAIRSSLLSRGQGLAQQNISQKILKSVPISLPSLKEQGEIIARVDELMTLCDQLEAEHNNASEAHGKRVSQLLATLTQSQSAEDFSASWQRIAAHFDTLFTTEASIDALKQTLLQLAIMGRLVPPNPNDEPASELFRHIQAKKAKLVAEGKIKKDKPLAPITDKERPFELPAGWVWVRLQDVIDVRDGTHDSPKNTTGPNTYPLVTSKDFCNGDINFETARRISEIDYIEISKRSLVEKYDILFSMIGGNIGNQVLVNTDRKFGIKNVALFKYYDKNLTSPFFIKKYMESLADSLQSSAIGGAQPFVALGSLRSLVMALPPLIEQHRIVAKVDELIALCDQLKSNLTEASLLQQKLADVLVEKAIV